MKYEVIIYWSEEDQAFVASMPDLPGCMADGKTYEEALAQIQVVANEWIATAQELGRAVPKPKAKHVPV
jgi:predicted RNase H-like HicB family nuclease